MGMNDVAALELHIEELVLRGFVPGDRASIGDAVQKELARLLTQQGLPGLAHGASIERVDGGSFQVAPGARGPAVGAQLARAVYRQLAPTTHGPARPMRSKP
jgi:hypothetical protein